MEVIVGEVGEEGDAPEEGYVIVGENTFSLDAGVGILDINEKLGLGLPEGDYQTVAGFLLERLGSIPSEGQILEFENLRFTIKVMDGVRIEQVVVEKEEQETGETIP
jgi:CBS domain containing-hemolysin-like protein